MSEEEKITCMDCIHFNVGTYMCSLDKSICESYCEKFKPINKTKQEGKK